MLLNSRIRLRRIIIFTWKVDIILIISCTVAFFMHHLLISKHVDVPNILPTVLGTAIAFFIGFNNNQAYGRWWEARKIWGALVNDSRSWARAILSYSKTSALITEEELADLQRRMVYRHIAFLYALKESLRGTNDSAAYKKYLSSKDWDIISRHTNKSNAILQLQSLQLRVLYDNGSVDGYPFLQLDQSIVNFTNQMGMSERIKNTVFPTTYSYLTKLFVWLFVISFELVTAESMGVWSIFISWLIGFVFVSTQINGMSLVNPFENVPTGIPLNQISRTIEINLLQMMNEENIPEPVKPVNNEYVL
jgi:putative membrane protein